jgi:hypothetical protein
MAEWALELPPSPAGPRERGIRVDWDPDRLRALGEAEPGYKGPPPWRHIGWGGTGLLRLISAAFEDGSLLAVAALRHEDASGHGEDSVGAVLARPGEEPAEIAETLLSTQYAADGGVRRLGLELYDDPDGAPIRVAADIEGTVMDEFHDGGSRAVMGFRMEGIHGSGLYESLRQG